MVRLAEILSSDGLMNHRVQVVDVPDREAWLIEACLGRSVLHVGCCDVPVFDPNKNLHITLARHASLLDGLDVSEPGLAELRKHVAGRYYSSSTEICRQYDLVLVPEVLEHTANAAEFLDAVFAVRARRYIITAPHIEWYVQCRREGQFFHEQVHRDHRAWYSPYTLLNAVRSHIAEEEDDVQVFLLRKTGSVGVSIEKAVGADGDSELGGAAIDDANALRQVPSDPLRRARMLLAAGQSAEALALLRLARIERSHVDLFYLEQEILLSLGRYVDALRAGVEFMKEHPRDAACLRFCARAADGLGDAARANELRALAADHERGPGKHGAWRASSKRRRRKP